MKITKTKLAAVSFGAALTSMYSAPELSAQVVDLSFTPSIVPFFSGFQAVSSAPTVVFGVPASDGVSSVSFNFFNDTFGRTFYGPPSAATFARVDPGDVFSGFVSADQTFTSIFFPFGSSFGLLTVTGIETFGFVLSGQAGFFRVDFGQQLGDPITLLDGQFNIGGSSITIPEVPTAVPEPSSVGLTALALGAVGLRRRRKVA